MVKCKHYKTCKHYREDSYTCQHDDEATDYCGVYDDEEAREEVCIVQ